MEHSFYLVTVTYRTGVWIRTVILSPLTCALAMLCDSHTYSSNDCMLWTVTSMPRWLRKNMCSIAPLVSDCFWEDLVPLSADTLATSLHRALIRPAGPRRCQAKRNNRTNNPKTRLELWINFVAHIFVETSLPHRLQICQRKSYMHREKMHSSNISVDFVREIICSDIILRDKV